MQKILVIDDDKEMQLLLSDIISPEGYKVITADTFHLTSFCWTSNFPGWMA
jgi:CheY-like chemotaxis protein